jgi:hypothetical protein
LAEKNTLLLEENYGMKDRVMQVQILAFEEGRHLALVEPLTDILHSAYGVILLRANRWK